MSGPLNAEVVGLGLVQVDDRPGEPDVLETLGLVDAGPAIGVKGLVRDAVDNDVFADDGHE